MSAAQIRMTRTPLVRRAALALALCLAAPVAAQPGHDHDHAGHGHDHDHDHAGHSHGPGGHGPRVDARKPLYGDWQVDVEATLAADPEMKKAASADGALAEARRLFGETRLRFTPDGRTTVRFPDGGREGLYVVTMDGDAMKLRIVDAQANQLNTADYDAVLKDGRLTMRQEGMTLVFVRPGPAGHPEKPELPRAQAKPIVGRWRVDIPRTLAADQRLKSMTAEQQKAARDAAEAFLSQLSFEWRGDGTASISMGGRSQDNHWRLVGKEGSRYTLDVAFDGGPEAGETLVLDVDGAFMRMTMGPQVLVLTRK